MKKVPGVYTLETPENPPPHYDRTPQYDKMIQERDVMIPMRDGVHLCGDIYRPDAPGKFPALLAFAPHNKDLQTPEACEPHGPQPAWSAFWIGAKEAGDTRFFVSRGYAHIVANSRNVGKSEDGPPSDWDHYDLIEWIAAQPWCDGNVGMVGMSAFSISQVEAARQHPPHLKAIFPWGPHVLYPFRDLFSGGVIHIFNYLISGLPVVHQTQGRPGTLPPEEEKLWQEAYNNPDYQMYSHLYNLLTQKGQLNRKYYDMLAHVHDTEESIKKWEKEAEKINIPAYTGAGWYVYAICHHLQGSQNWYAKMTNTPYKRLLFTGPASAERPWHAFHEEILRWYDHWLKGIDTGMLKEPKVKMWVMGANQWYQGDDWPLPETKWTKYYLHSWERLREVPFLPLSRDTYEQPDGFVQMPPTQTRVIQKLRYCTDPLPEDTMIAGPSALYLYAAIDQEDTNWMVALKDIGPDETERTGKELDNFIPTNLPERELTRGWLKASHRAMDKKRSKPYKPWHLLTREAQKPVVPGEVNEYAIEILSTANLFKRGHRICIDIMSMDMPTGAAGFHNVEFYPYHICSSKMTLHKIYHNEKYPSHLLLPVIPKENWVEK